METRMAYRLRTALRAVLGVGLVSLIGCGEGVAEPGSGEQAPPRPEEMRQTGSELYVAHSTLWRPMNVPVCWENPSTGDETKRQWVRDAVARTWEARSGVRFTGWDACVGWAQASASTSTTPARTRKRWATTSTAWPRAWC